MNSSLITHHSPRFFVKWRGYAVRFHTNACGKNYSLVDDAEATPFDSMTEAVITAKKFNLRQADLKFEKLPVAAPRQSAANINPLEMKGGRTAT